MSSVANINIQYHGTYILFITNPASSKFSVPDDIENPSTKYVTKYNKPAFITILNSPSDTKFIGNATNLIIGLTIIFTKPNTNTATASVKASNAIVTPGNISDVAIIDIALAAKALKGSFKFIIQ